jgi:hypothetical protein
MRRIIPGVDVYRTPVRARHPLFTAPALRGAGTVRYGQPSIGTRGKYLGYANPPQLFTGYDPRKVAAGTFRGAPGALPSTTSPVTALNNPLQRNLFNMSPDGGK